MHNNIINKIKVYRILVNKIKLDLHLHFFSKRCENQIGLRSTASYPGALDRGKGVKCKG